MAGARSGRDIPLWLRGLRSRPLVNALLLVLATVAVATAMLGPLLVRAVHQFTVQSGAAAAPREETSVALSLPAPGETADELRSAYDQASGTLLGLLQFAVFRAGSTAWQQPVATITSTSNLSWTGTRAGTPVSSRISVAEASCTATYALAAGRCPAKVGEVLVSVPDAERSGLAVGSPLVLPQLETGPERLRVVGTYDPVASDIGQLVRPGTAAGGLAAVTAEPLLMTADQAATLLLPAKVTGRLALASTVSVEDLPGIRATLAAVDAGVLGQRTIVEVQTALPVLLARIDDQARTATVLMAVSVIQAVALALFATAIVLQRVARTRAAEWGIGRLRGVPRSRWLASVYAEPGLVLLAGLPIGYAAGAALARAAVDRHLGEEVPVELGRWPVLLVAGLAAGGALVALVAVSLRSLRRPLPELISSATEPRRLTVLGAVAQSTVILLAATSLYQLLAGGVLGRERSQLGLLAPALSALALAVIAVRVAVLVVRRVTTRPPRSLAALVVGRQAARTPSTLNPAVVAATGIALAVFATQVLALVQQNADLRAAAVVGADEVLEVAVPPGADLVRVVRTADPSGQWAMAAVERRGSLTAGSSRIVAVDTSRLTAVSTWSPRWAEVADVPRLLRTATKPPVELRGRRVEVTLADARVETQPGVNPGTGRTALDAPVSAPVLQLTVDTGTAWRRVELGPVGTGTTRLRADLPCAEPCRLVSLAMVSGFGSAYDAAFTVTGVATDQQPVEESVSWLREPGQWREVVGGRTTPEITQLAGATAAGNGLDLSFSDDQGDRATAVAPADIEDPLPALLGPDVEVAPFPGRSDTANGTGLDGRGQLIRVVGRATVLPRSLRDGVLVDLVNARGLVDPTSNDGVSQVWLRAGAPASVEQGLTDAGLRVQSRQSRVEVATELRRQAVPRAAVLSVWVGGTALLLAVLTLVAGRVADAGRRRRDWAALRQAGLPSRTLRRLAFAEIALPALLGAAIGLLAGQAAIRLAAAKLPLADPVTPSIPLDLSTSWLPVAVIGAATAAAILVAAAVVAGSEIRPERAR